MKITLITSNQNRHNYLINLLSELSDELFVIQECGTIFPGIVPNHYPKSLVMQRYFKKVNASQVKIFGENFIDSSKKNIKLLSMLFGDLNRCALSFLSDFLKSDIYVIYGSSYIKGDLINFLLKQKAINIHMGVSPYYRGTDCNFWSLYDNNPHLVGATIHSISKGIDSGAILYHAMSNIKTNPFEYTMSTVKSAFHSIAERIKDQSIFNIKSLIQDKNKEIRHSYKMDFNEEIVKKFFEKKIDINSKKIDKSLLKEPFFLN